MKFSASLTIAATLLLSAGHAAAQQNDPSIRVEQVTASVVEVKNDFLVSPTRFVETLQPGTSKTIDISVMNREGRPVTYRLFRQDFAPDSEQNDIRLYTDTDGPYSARNWVTSVTEFTIEHGERATIPVTISVPPNASAGDHYTTIMIRHKDGPDSDGIGIIAQVGILLIITADGDIVRSGDIVSFSSWYPIYWARKAMMTLKYKNTGTVHLVPTGLVRITNIFGVTVDEIPFRDWYVYRSSIRSRELVWEPRFALGRYTARLSLTDGAHDAAHPIIASTSFWILPIVPLIIILCVIVVLSLLSQLLLSHYEIKRKK